MLTLRVEGEKHPKSFFLVTDDSDGELDRLQEIIHDEIEAAPDDLLRQMLDNHTAEEFRAGVQVPQSEVGDIAEVLEGDWPDAAEIVYDQARDALDQLEED